MGTAISTYDDLVAAIKPYLESGTDFTLDYERDGSTFETTVNLVDGQAAEYLGITNQAYTYYPSLGQALRGSVAYGGLVAEYAVKLIVPTHTMEVLDQSSSVVGISVMASDGGLGWRSHARLLHWCHLDVARLYEPAANSTA